MGAGTGQLDELPAVTTTADGTYVPGADAGWFYFKFGDTGQSGPYFLLISLSTGALVTPRTTRPHRP